MNEADKLAPDIAPDQSGRIPDPLSNKKNRFPVPIWVAGFLLLFVVIEIMCLTRFPTDFSEYRTYMTADRKAANGETKDAIEDLFKLSAAHPKSTAIVFKTIDLSMENGYYDMAATVHDNYVTSMNLSDSDYSHMNMYAVRLESYYKTCDAIDQILKKETDAKAPENIDSNAISKSIEALLLEPGQDNAVIYYYLGLLDQSGSEDVKNYLQKSYDLDPECFDVRVQLGVIYRSLGDYEQAKKLNQEALKKDKSDSGALRSAAIIQMLEGDLKGGLSTAQKAYEADPDGLYIRETYLIALTLNDRKEDALTIRNEMIATGDGVDTDTDQLLLGQITLEDYYVRG